jgi:prepilin signal peptidase PulO-like enzyme (type II secretory pathway)
MGSLMAITAVRSGGRWVELVIVALLAIPLAVTLLTDLLARLVYPAVLAPGLIAALAVAALEPGGLAAALLSGGVAAAVAGGLVLLASWRWPNTAETPLGGGDILIAATAGAMLGPERTATALFAGMVLAAIIAGVLLLTGRAQRAEPIPYGVFLCGTTLIALAV